MHEPPRDGVRKRKIILKLHSRTPSLLQDCASLSARLGLIAKSGFILKVACHTAFGLEIQRPKKPQL
jgi:hypothetical protein